MRLVLALLILLWQTPPTPRITVYGVPGATYATIGADVADGEEIVITAEPALPDWPAHQTRGLSCAIEPARWVCATVRPPGVDWEIEVPAALTLRADGLTQIAVRQGDAVAVWERQPAPTPEPAYPVRAWLPLMGR